MKWNKLLVIILDLDWNFKEVMDYKYFKELILSICKFQLPVADPFLERILNLSGEFTIYNRN